MQKKDNPSMHLFLICYTCNAGHVLPSRQSLIFSYWIGCVYMEKAAPVACVQSRQVGPVGEKICPEEESETNVATCWIIKAFHALLTFNYYFSS